MAAKFTVSATDVIVYAKERQKHDGGTFFTYSTKISSKDNDGQWHSAFIPLGFRKGVSIANKAVINIKNAFYTLDTFKDELKLMVMDYDLVSGGEGKGGVNSLNMAVEEEPFMNVPEGDFDELPFGRI